jgi:heat shock protein HslJ
MRIRTAIFLLALLLSACVPEEDPQLPLTGGETPPVTLAGSQWILETIYNTPVIEGSLVSAEFAEGADALQVSGLSGCNTYSGTAVEDGNSLDIAELSWTEMACVEPLGIMEQEQRYLQALTMWQVTSALPNASSC